MKKSFRTIYQHFVLKIYEYFKQFPKTSFGNDKKMKKQNLRNILWAGIINSFKSTPDAFEKACL